jgi:PDZ domain-containing secreted protein
LDVQHKKNHGEDRVYLSKVEHPAPAHNLKVGDRIVALNGKKIEAYDSLDAIRNEIHNNNVVRLVVDPTMLS